MRITAYQGNKAHILRCAMGSDCAAHYNRGIYTSLFAMRRIKYTHSEI